MHNQDFNPRSPCGERPYETIDPGAFDGISIHAPRVGSDGRQDFRQLVHHAISIHAPRVGSDARYRLIRVQMHHFNPRSPCGERRQLGQRPAHSQPISIHAPRVGSDSWSTRHPGRFSGFQSTLPVWGATNGVYAKLDRLEHFNPRSPCGERQQHWRYIQSCRRFQSTLPVWGATTRWAVCAAGWQFQSTLPVWGATTSNYSMVGLQNISIHAPRVGSDIQTSTRDIIDAIFQSTLPVWGATLPAVGLWLTPIFQSTLPVWGATGRAVEATEVHHIFQSTLPVWGATWMKGVFGAASLYFNPRSPCGERR